MNSATVNQHLLLFLFFYCSFLCQCYYSAPPNSNNNNSNSSSVPSNEEILKLIETLGSISPSKTPASSSSSGGGGKEKDLTAEDLLTMSSFANLYCSRSDDCDEGTICVIDDPSLSSEPPLIGTCHRISGFMEPCEGGDPQFAPICDPRQNLYCSYPDLLGWLMKKLGKSGLCVRSYSPPRFLKLGPVDDEYA